MTAAFDLLDRRAKITDAEFLQAATKLNLTEAYLTRLDQICRMKYPCGGLDQLRAHLGAGHGAMRARVPQCVLRRLAQTDQDRDRGRAGAPDTGCAVNDQTVAIAKARAAFEPRGWSSED